MGPHLTKPAPPDSGHTRTRNDEYPGMMIEPRSVLRHTGRLSRPRGRVHAAGRTCSLAGGCRALWQVLLAQSIDCGTVVALLARASGCGRCAPRVASSRGRAFVLSQLRTEVAPAASPALLPAPRVASLGSAEQPCGGVGASAMVVPKKGCRAASSPQEVLRLAGLGKTPPASCQICSNASCMRDGREDCGVRAMWPFAERGAARHRALRMWRRSRRPAAAGIGCDWCA